MSRRSWLPRWWSRLVSRLPMSVALAAVAGVWVLGCVWSFTEQTAFATTKGFSDPALLPLVIDGLAAAMGGVAFAASLDGRPAVSARIGTALAVLASATSNGLWAAERSSGPAGPDWATVAVGAGIPIAANIAFEVLLAELRRQVQRRRGLPAPTPLPTLRVARLLLAPRSTFAMWRREVLARTAPAPLGGHLSSSPGPSDDSDRDEDAAVSSADDRVALPRPDSASTALTSAPDQRSAPDTVRVAASRTSHERSETPQDADTNPGQPREWMGPEPSPRTPPTMPWPPPGPNGGAHHPREARAGTDTLPAPLLPGEQPSSVLTWGEHRADVGSVSPESGAGPPLDAEPGGSDPAADTAGPDAPLDVPEQEGHVGVWRLAEHMLAARAAGETLEERAWPGSRVAELVGCSRRNGQRLVPRALALVEVLDGPCPPTPPQGVVLGDGLATRGGDEGPAATAGGLRVVGGTGEHD